VEAAVISDVVFSMLVLATAGLTASTIGFAVAWVRARERAIRAEQRTTQALDTGGGGGSDARFDRLEQAVESMALEVERMTEGQRFLSKLLAERSEHPGHVGQERESPVRIPPSV
jgi:hypothetical protein